MHNANKPRLSELPTTGQLLRSTALAAGVAGALLVVFVMPAEYGIDPTRVGTLLGLTEMGEMKRMLAMEAAADARADTLAAGRAAQAVAVGRAASTSVAEAGATGSPAVAVDGRTDRTVITLEPNAGAEIKLVMAAGARARFTWSSSGGKVNFDTHADRPGVKYHGYGKGSSRREEGELVAAFDGKHGWFWRNRSGAPVTITLDTSGGYSEVKRVV